VVVLGQAGEVRGIYCGCGKASDVKAVDLLATELDNIIVLDIYSMSSTAKEKVSNIRSFRVKVLY
jgi:hypothetical protein